MIYEPKSFQTVDFTFTQSEKLSGILYFNFAYEVVSKTFVSHKPQGPPSTILIKLVLPCSLGDQSHAAVPLTTLSIRFSTTMTDWVARHGRGTAAGAWAQSGPGSSGLLTATGTGLGGLGSTCSVVCRSLLANSNAAWRSVAITTDLRVRLSFGDTSNRFGHSNSLGV